WCSLQTQEQPTPQESPASSAPHAGIVAKPMRRLCCRIILRMSRAFTLYRLQQVDTQLDQGAARLAEITRILNDNAALQAASLAHQGAQARLHSAHSALRAAEEEVASQQRCIANNQASLYGGAVTNPKELQDLQKEAEALA